MIMKAKKSILDILLILNLVISKNCFLKNLSLSIIVNISSKSLTEKKLISSKKISFQNYIINVGLTHLKGSEIAELKEENIHIV